MKSLFVKVFAYIAGKASKEHLIAGLQLVKKYITPRTDNQIDDNIVDLLIYMLHGHDYRDVLAFALLNNGKVDEETLKEFVRVKEYLDLARSGKLDEVIKGHAEKIGREYIGKDIATAHANSDLTELLETATKTTRLRDVRGRIVSRKNKR